MIPLLAAIALAAPPKATLDTGTARVPLAISSWCWGTRCGAPIARSTKIAAVAPGATVTVELRFAPARVHLAVGGKRLTAARRGREVSWVVRRGGGVTLTATGGRGWVTYVGRIRLR
ncbi:MAG TPA: hypothetical protein VFK17_03485 [Gaiellaceae bacterium]|nr:hypothetical protein [Gaiellaceae bacterium]